MLSRRIQRDTTKTDHKQSREAPSSDVFFNVTEAQKSHSRNRQVGMLLYHVNVNIIMVLFIHSIRVLHLSFIVTDEQLQLHRGCYFPMQASPFSQFRFTTMDCI